MLIFKDRKIKDLAWFPVFSAPRYKAGKKEKAVKKKATKPESAYYSYQDKYSVKHGYIPLGRSLTVPKKHDSFFAMIRSILKEKTKKEPEYNWGELITLPCHPKEAELAVKLDVDERQLRVSGKNIPIEKPKVKTIFTRTPVRIRPHPKLRKRGTNLPIDEKDASFQNDSPILKEEEIQPRWVKIIQIPQDADLRTLLYRFSERSMHFTARRYLPDFEHVPVDVFAYSSK